MIDKIIRYMTAGLDCYRVYYDSGKVVRYSNSCLPDTARKFIYSCDIVEGKEEYDGYRDVVIFLKK